MGLQQESALWSWVILATVFVDLFINYSLRIGYGVVLPEMISNLGFTRTDTASIYNSYLFAYIAVTPFSGYLTDRLCAWTPFYGIGAILSHWVTGLLRDSTGVYTIAFLSNGVMALAGLALILFVRKRRS